MLSLAFCCPATAGVIHNPPPEPAQTAEESALLTPAGAAGAEPAEPGAPDGLTELTLELLAALPALF